MIIGNPSIFAIESEITIAYSRLGLRALGFFVIHIGGRAYGVRESDATMLACSFDEVQERILRRESHVAPFADHRNAGDIADAFRDVVYAPEDDDVPILGVPRPHLRQTIFSNHLQWAPDGDAAFDDGSYVLHFDVENRVRLIAYGVKPSGDDYKHDPNTLSDQWLDSDEFYGVLTEWRDAFIAEWEATPKTPENQDGVS